MNSPLRVSMKLNRAIRILQTDKLLPRCSPSGLMTLSTSPLDDRDYCSSSFAWSALSLQPSSSSSLLPPSSISRTHNFLCYRKYNYRFSYPNYYTTTATSEPTTMVKDSIDAAHEETIKDELREGFAKGGCDFDPSNRAFDEILPHLLNIYASHATPQDFDIYAPDATFEDPLMRAQGIKQIKSAFYSIPKLFRESRITEYTIKENVISPGKKEILMDNKQYYKFLGKDIHMISLIKLQIEDGKIIRHEDWWDKKPLRNKETVQLPLVGRFAEMTRRASMLATHCLMGFGKDPSN